MALDLSAATLHAVRVLLGRGPLDLLLVDGPELGLVLVPVFLSSNWVFISDDVVRRHSAPNTVEVFALDDDPRLLQKLAMLTSTCSGL